MPVMMPPTLPGTEYRPTSPQSLSSMESGFASLPASPNHGTVALDMKLPMSRRTRRASLVRNSNVQLMSIFMTVGVHF